VAPAVAICQPSIILGGRLHVLLHMIAVLNELGIVPDVLTTSMGFAPGDLPTRYKLAARANFKVVRDFSLPGAPHDVKIVLFNWLLRRRGRSYDLLINTSNSLALLPGSQPVLSYVFYPRKARIMSPLPDIHLPESRLVPWSKAGIEKHVLRLLYRMTRLHDAHRVVCMTQFTRDATWRHYNLPAQTGVIYPPVNLDDYSCQGRVRRRAVVTVGRFTAAKRQLEQVKLAAALPELVFDIVGFVSDANYYTLCRRYVAEHGISNVRFHANAPFARMVELMTSARYFLHTTIDEPFGLTAVQAIAAGCLPIVHDSGGQRETVPVGMLRYERFQNIPDVIRSTEAMAPEDSEHVMERLQAHVRREYSPHAFATQMRSVLEDMLGRATG
jgi:glycosyltransferase involved in cell wall biosynthesis